MRSSLLALMLCTLVAAPLRAEPTFGRGARVEQLIARGNAYRHGGDSISGLAFYRDAVAAAPRDPRGYEALGAAYLELNELARALEVYEAGARATNGEPSLLLGLARTYLLLHRDERALEVLRALTRALPDSREGLEALADAAERTGRWTEALAVRRAIARKARGGPDAGAAAAAVRALEIILGRADRVRHGTSCAAEGSEVARALARCP